jgi:azurin
MQLKTPRIGILVATGAIATGAGAVALASAASASAAEVLHLTANPSGMLKFNTTKLSVPKPGTVTIDMTNPSTSGIPHGIKIIGHGVKVTSKIAESGQTVSVTANLKKGTYTFLCPVPGHAMAGMKGTLTVL